MRMGALFSTCMPGLSGLHLQQEVTKADATLSVAGLVRTAGRLGIDPLGAGPDPTNVG